MVLWTWPNSLTGAFGLQRGQGQAIQRVGGFFENENMAEGRIHFRDAPEWLANAVSQAAWAPNAAAPVGQKGNAFRGPLGNAPVIAQPQVLRQQAKTLWDEYAKALYITAVFQGRQGSLTGKVRFDIAPGSTIAVVINEEKFVAAAGVVFGEQTLYGVVTGVTTILNSDAAQGYTAIELSHIRNELEQADENLTVEKHPLWTEPFLGAPLVEDFEELPAEEVAE